MGVQFFLNGKFTLDASGAGVCENRLFYERDGLRDFHFLAILVVDEPVLSFLLLILCWCLNFGGRWISFGRLGGFVEWCCGVTLNGECRSQPETQNE